MRFVGALFALVLFGAALHSPVLADNQRSGGHWRSGGQSSQVPPRTQNQPSTGSPTWGGRHQTSQSSPTTQNQPSNGNSGLEMGPPRPDRPGSASHPESALPRELGLEMGPSEPDRPGSASHPEPAVQRELGLGLAQPESNHGPQQCSPGPKPLGMELASRSPVAPAPAP